MRLESLEGPIEQPLTDEHAVQAEVARGLDQAELAYKRGESLEPYRDALKNYVEANVSDAVFKFNGMLNVVRCFARDYATDVECELFAWAMAGLGKSGSLRHAIKVYFWRRMSPQHCNDFAEAIGNVRGLMSVGLHYKGRSY